MNFDLRSLGIGAMFLSSREARPVSVGKLCCHCGPRWWIIILLAWPASVNRLVCLVWKPLIAMQLFNALDKDMGFADQVYYYMAQNYGHYANIFAGVTAGLLLVMYLFDAENWSKSRGGTVLLYPSAAVLVVAAWLYIVMIADVHPYGNICLFALLNPVWLLLIKALFYSKVTQRTFLSWLGGPFLLVSVLSVAAWIVWLLWDEEHEWDDVTKVEAAERTGCAPDFEPFPGCRGEAGCEGAQA